MVNHMIIYNYKGGTNKKKGGNASEQASQAQKEKAYNRLESSHTISNCRLNRRNYLTDNSKNPVLVRSGRAKALP